jgi:protein-export membrane protein SecD
MFALFKYIPVTLSSAGIAGFIISLGMAVDANILIFERMKEEFKSGHSLQDSISEGFNRAWTSIRDGNISSIISAFVLFVFGTTLIKGFAITFGLGVIVSMLSAIIISRVFLKVIAGKKYGRIKQFLFSSGFSK